MSRGREVHDETRGTGRRIRAVVRFVVSATGSHLLLFSSQVTFDSTILYTAARQASLSFIVSWSLLKLSPLIQ